MNDPLTVPARDGIEAQRGHNDIFPGDPYPVADQLKRGLEALRKQVSGRGRISSLEVFALTDPLMDILSRVSPASPPSHDAELLAALREARDALKKLVLGFVNLLESGRDRIMDLGGDCDPVDVMEAGDPRLRAAKATLAKIEAALAPAASQEGR